MLFYFFFIIYYFIILFYLIWDTSGFGIPGDLGSCRIWDPVGFGILWSLGSHGIWDPGHDTGAEVAPGALRSDRVPLVGNIFGRAGMELEWNWDLGWNWD